MTEEGPYRDAIEVKSGDEVGQLTAAFNEMMEGFGGTYGWESQKQDDLPP